MSHQEVDRHEVISRVLRQEITAQKAGELLQLSKRQVKRLKKKLRQQGAAGLIHGNRGKPSPNAIPKPERRKIISLLHAKYPDFKPTFAAEKLLEHHAIDRDPKTIRQIMIDEQLWTVRNGKGREAHRAWRPRKDAYGEMIQFDGSYHDWYEGRGVSSEQCLLAAIDDATSTVVTASFSAHEGVFPVLGFWRAYVLTAGKPRCVYLDKFSTYKMNQRVAVENPDLKTQFQRVCDALGIELIFANSPQAKGRVERLFGTLQDRLVKDLRLAAITNDHTANAFLGKTYLAKFNRQFSVPPTASVNLHRPLTADERKNLDSIFSRHSERTVQNDFTFAFKNQWYQLIATQSIAVQKKDIITVEEYLDHTIHVRRRGKELQYLILPDRPAPLRRGIPWVLATSSAPRPAWKPAPDHPWRQRLFVKSFRTPTHLPASQGDSLTSRKG